MEQKVAEKALRYNTGKLKWSYVHFGSLEPMVRVLMYGADKYTVGSVSGAHNWKKGLNKTEVLESMQRHLTALMDGQEIDPESGFSHMGHIQCNAMFYNYFNNETLQSKGQREAATLAPDIQGTKTEAEG